MNDFWKNYTAARDLHAERRYNESIALTAVAIAKASTPTEEAMGHWLQYANRARQGAHPEAIRHLEVALELENEPAQRLRLQCALVGQYRNQGRLTSAKRVQQEVLGAMNWPGGEARSYDFTKELWFAQNHRTFRETLLMLASRNRSLELVEIGSLQGMSACYMVDLLYDVCSFQITCIDPEFQPEFLLNIGASRLPSSVRAISGTSQDVLGNLEPDSIDFIHVDGWHVAPQVLLDGLYGMNIAAPGAYIVFDDYLKEDQTIKGQTVKRGVSAFLRIFEPYIRIVHEGRQLICETRSKAYDPALVSAKTNSVLSEILGREIQIRGSTLKNIADSVRDHFEELLSASWKAMPDDTPDRSQRGVAR